MRDHVGDGAMFDSLLNPVHILILLAVVVVIFGPKRLPEMGRKIGQTLREINTATSEIRSQVGLDEIAGSVQDIKSSLSLTGGAASETASQSGEMPAVPGASEPTGPSAAEPTEAAGDVPTASRVDEATAGGPRFEDRAGVETFGRLSRSGRPGQDAPGR